MSFLSRIFGGGDEPSERQIRRALKQTLQMHGDAATRLGAMERLARWGTPESAAALLRRFTVRVPQASMDHEEKQYTVRLLTQMGETAVGPILQYLKTEPEVTWPVRALREILPPETFEETLRGVLESMASTYTRWPEAKTVLIQHIPPGSYGAMKETVTRFLEDDDDDVCIAAATYLARHGDEDVRERMIEIFLESEGRPRVRGSILDLLCELELPVKGYRKRVEEAIADPYYLTSKGTVKRREL